MTNTQSNCDELYKKANDILVSYGCRDSEQLKQMGLQSQSLAQATRAMCELIQSRECAAELRLINKVFELSPTKNFEHWKPQDALKFFERLKDLDKQLTNTQAGEGDTNAK